MEDATPGFRERVMDAVAEFQLAYHALLANGTTEEDVLDFLKANGFGDEATAARVARAADRLIEDGMLEESAGSLVVTADGEEEVRRLADALPDSAPGDADEVLGLTRDASLD